MTRIPKLARNVLVGCVATYLLIALTLAILVQQGVIERAPPTPKGPVGDDSIPDELPNKDIETRLTMAQGFVYDRLARDDGHVDLYYYPSGNASHPDATDTNSEAASYYLLWTAQAGDKAAFDSELAFIKQHMIHPSTGHMMWRLEGNDSVITDGANIASDADLRAIKALLIAEKRWKDPAYTAAIDGLAQGLETVAITSDGYLAPYGNGPKENPWRAQEVWISYADFTVTKELAHRRGEPWITLDRKMREAALGGQIHNGLFNSELTATRAYGNGIDGGVYSINSMWIMIRMAESDDPALRAAANRSLEFYRQKEMVDGQLFATYGSNGDALSPDDTPWVYALVGRAAAALDDEAFADEMVRQLLAKQVNDPRSPLEGSFAEGSGRDLRAGQFTMQESILTMQEYLAMRERIR